MALRVLLADESSTIKKVFQLALQDFAVEVRPVNIGLDVLPVAKSFQPDIVFADVLLQKKSGYEVSMELKTNPALGKVPVVLMWSGFMELDEDKFQASMANGRLEKPFDVTTLRKLVTELVPKTQTQRLSEFLTFPKLPELEEKQQPPAPAARMTPPPPPPLPKTPEEDFEQVPIQKMRSGAERFRIPPGSEDSELPIDLQEPSGPIDVANILRDTDEPEEFSIRENKTVTGIRHAAVTPSAPRTAMPERRPAVAAAPPPPPPAAFEPPAPVVPTVSEADVERIVREQTREMIEAVVWKVLPELAQQIIEREIQKLLKEKDASLYR